MKILKFIAAVGLFFNLMGMAVTQGTIYNRTSIPLWVTVYDATERGVGYCVGNKMIAAGGTYKYGDSCIGVATNLPANIIKYSSSIVFSNNKNAVGQSQPTTINTHATSELDDIMLVQMPNNTIQVISVPNGTANFGRTIRSQY